MNETLNVGIFGGAFDPPHIGHLIIAEHARQVLKLDKILWIPLNIPSHKFPTHVSAAHRLKMVELAIQDNPYFGSSDIEIKRGGVSYMIDTIVELKRLSPSTNFYLIIGEDEARNFPKWKDYKKILQLAQIIVAKRPITEQDSKTVVGPHSLFTNISSTNIRELLKQGKSIKYLVPESINEYIRKMELYTDKKIKFENGQPCSHPGCLHHMKHPCEGCGRIAGQGVVYETEEMIK